MVECFKRLAIRTSIGSILQAKASVWFLPGFVCMDYSSYWYRYYLYGYLQVSEQLLNVLFLPGISRGRNRYYMYGYLQVSQHVQVLFSLFLPGIGIGIKCIASSRYQQRQEQVLYVWLLTGVGADDTFILVKSWRTFQNQKPDPDTAEHDHVIDLVRRTMRQSVMTMIVTSVTTSAAFFASSVSSITAIKCFR